MTAASQRSIEGRTTASGPQRHPARLTLTLGLTLVALMAAASPAATQPGDGTASLGGGSSLEGGQVIEVPAGVALPPIHHLFVENPEAHPVEVAFTAQTPQGTTVTPEWERRSLEPGETASNPFSIDVAGTAAPGDHPITVQIVRADLQTQPGTITNVPAVGARFVIRVVGTAAHLTVRAVDAHSGDPVEGTLSLSAVDADDGTVELYRTTGAELAVRVAPGRYLARFLLGDRVMARSQLEIAAGEDREIVLEVETVGFVLVAAKPLREGGRVVVVDLIASVRNDLAPVENATLRAVVLHDQQHVDTVVLQDLSPLPVEITEAKTTYRPADGWQPGSYTFRFELVTPRFTLTASDQPTIGIAGGLPGWIPGAAAAFSVALAAAWLLTRRLRRPTPARPRPAATPHARKQRPTTQPSHEPIVEDQPADRPTGDGQPRSSDEQRIDLSRFTAR